MRSGVGRPDLGVAAPRVRGAGVEDHGRTARQLDACPGRNSELAGRPGEGDGWCSPVDGFALAEDGKVGWRLRCSTDRPAGRPVGQLATRLAIPPPSGRVPGSRGRSAWRRGQSPQGPRGSDQNGKVKKQWDAESTGKGTGAGRQAVVYMLSEQPEDTQTNIYISVYRHRCHSTS